MMCSLAVLKIISNHFVRHSLCVMWEGGYHIYVAFLESVQSWTTVVSNLRWNMAYEVKLPRTYILNPVHPSRCALKTLGFEPESWEGQVSGRNRPSRLLAWPEIHAALCLGSKWFVSLIPESCSCWTLQLLLCPVRLSFYVSRRHPICIGLLMTGRSLPDFSWFSLRIEISYPRPPSFLYHQSSPLGWRSSLNDYPYLSQRVSVFLSMISSGHSKSSMIIRH